MNKKKVVGQCKRQKMIVIIISTNTLADTHSHTSTSTVKLQNVFLSFHFFVSVHVQTKNICVFYIFIFHFILSLHHPSQCIANGSMFKRSCIEQNERKKKKKKLRAEIEHEKKNKCVYVCILKCGAVCGVSWTRIIITYYFSHYVYFTCVYNLAFENARRRSIADQTEYVLNGENREHRRCHRRRRRRRRCRWNEIVNNDEMKNKRKNKFALELNQIREKSGDGDDGSGSNDDDRSSHSYTVHSTHAPMPSSKCCPRASFISRTSTSIRATFTRKLVYRFAIISRTRSISVSYKRMLPAYT